MRKRHVPRAGPPGAGLVLAAAAWLAVPAAAEETPAERHPALHGAYYDMSVCEYCQLVTREVLDGYRREVADLIARDSLTPSQDREVRLHAWTEADLEYGNRGLGGFRNWCRTEGAAAAKRFLDYRARALPDDAGAQ